MAIYLCHTPGCGSPAVFADNDRLWCSKCYCKNHGIKLAPEQPTEQSPQRLK